MSKNTNSVNSGAMPYTGHATVSIRDRRHFIGGSDARIIMGKDKRPSCVSGAKSAARKPHSTCQEC